MKHNNMILLHFFLFTYNNYLYGNRKGDFMTVLSAQFFYYDQHNTAGKSKHQRSYVGFGQAFAYVYERLKYKKTL